MNPKKILEISNCNHFFCHLEKTCSRKKCTSLLFPIFGTGLSKIACPENREQGREDDRLKLNAYLTSIEVLQMFINLVPLAKFSKKGLLRLLAVMWGQLSKGVLRTKLNNS